MNRQAVYAKVTAGILERLEAGVAPWHQPWSSPVSPRNLVTRRPYSGINALALGFRGGSPYWLTFRQAQQHGWTVKGGAKGSPVLFVNRRTLKPAVRDARGDVVEKAVEQTVLRYYHVFNIDDVDGIAPERVPVAKHAWSPIEAAERLVQAVKPAPWIQHGGDKAYFSPAVDAINLPAPQCFSRADDYHATLFHELTHWTGHKTRLDRETLRLATRFGDGNYSLEELVAEMGAGLLCAMTGIANDVMDRNASYLHNWLKVLRATPALLVKAASQAQKAVDFLSPASKPLGDAEAGA